MKISREDAQCAAFVFDLVETFKALDAVMVVKTEAGSFDITAAEEMPEDGNRIAACLASLHTASGYLSECGIDSDIEVREDKIWFNAFGLCECDVSELIGKIKHVGDAEFGTVYTAVDRGERSNAN